MVHRVGMMEILRVSIGEREGLGAVLRMMSDVTDASGRSAWRRTLLPNSKCRQPLTAAESVQTIPGLYIDDQEESNHHEPFTFILIYVSSHALLAFRGRGSSHQSQAYSPQLPSWVKHFVFTYCKLCMLCAPISLSFWERQTAVQF